MSNEVVEVPVFFRHRGEIYRGRARFYAKRHHIVLRGRLLRTGGWDYSLATKEMGDDKFAIREDQFDALKGGRSVEVDFGSGEPTIVEPGEYSPPRDNRSQGALFDS
jgi:hypothetical protein